jgi:hypothetical protein
MCEATMEISYFDNNNNNAFLLSFFISCYLRGHPKNIYCCFKTYYGLNDKILQDILTNISLAQR